MRGKVRLVFRLLFTFSLVGFLNPTFGAMKLDQTFIARILGVSESKRTILVNKGREQGLYQDMHAKLSLPSGIIARAVVVKLAPSRSVWSVYRVFSKKDLESQTVATFKVSSPVKLTTDESKELGALADKVNKKKEEIPQDQTEQKKQEKIGKQILKSERLISQFDEVDYSKLEAEEQIPEQTQLDPDLDWSGLNGKKDGEGFDRSLDYSNLR